MQMEYNGFPREDDHRVLHITRRITAPRLRIWQAWADPRQARQWMRPRGFTATHLEGDLRPGGHWRACLRRDEDGEELWQGGRFLEVVAPERLVYTFAWNVADQHRGHETRITLQFTEQRGFTTQEFRQAVFASGAERDGHRDGWNSSFDRLVEFLAAGAVRDA